MSYVHKVFGQNYIWDDKLQSMRPMDLTNPNERMLVDQYRCELGKSFNILKEDVTVEISQTCGVIPRS